MSSSFANRKNRKIAKQESVLRENSFHSGAIPYRIIIISQHYFYFNLSCAETQLMKTLINVATYDFSSHHSKNLLGRDKGFRN